MGKGAAKASQQVLEQSASKMTGLMDNLLRESEPARRVPMEFYTSIIKGGPEADRMLGPSTEVIRKQFSQAREAIERSMPRGGGLDKAKMLTHIAEAGDVSSQRNNLLQDSLARLASMGVFGTQSGISAGQGSISAGNSLANLSAMRGQAFASGMGGIAGGLGSYFGGK